VRRVNDRFFLRRGLRKRAGNGAKRNQGYNWGRVQRETRL
jgi:hypothetical protein